MAKLITIGDSISQGFMSLGAAKTGNSYSTLLAEQLGLKPQHNYFYPEWPMGGIPLNLERMFRYLAKYYGDDIWGPFEWTTASIRISNYIDKLEDYYERGEGKYNNPTDAAGFHNLSSFGFNVSDAWEMFPKLCRFKLENDDADNFMSPPDNSFYRSAYKVLNPKAEEEYDMYSQLKWIEHYAQNDTDGVENLVIWLGANNALGTILDMEVSKADMSIADYKLLNDHFSKLKYNLWSPELFRYDYSELLTKIVNILNTPEHNNKQPDWNVFLGTVPAVTIAPIAKGVGEASEEQDPFYVVTHKNVNYYEYYTYLVFNESDCKKDAVPFLSKKEALEIDNCIAGFNQAIKELAEKKNRDLGKEHFHIVDTNASLLNMAYKRNGGNPEYEFPLGLLEVTKKPDTRFYKAEQNEKTEGGIFSLDGVHPGQIGHGVIAAEFAKVMKNAGVNIEPEFNWQGIVDSDSLTTSPLAITNELYQHHQLIKLVMELLKVFGKE